MSAATVLLTRLDALELAIRQGDWAEVERQYDRVRSTAERLAGTRDRDRAGERLLDAGVLRRARP